MLDYDTSKGINPQTGEEWANNLPKSNVLQFVTEDGSLISARPSGTEPKIVYFSVKENLKKAEDYDEVNSKLDAKIESIIADMNLKIKSF